MQKELDSMDELALAIGHATIAWGWLQDSLGELFSAVLYGGLDETGLACWHAHKNDRTQRGMLVAAAESKLAPHPHLKDKVISIARKVDGMSALRNDMIHASYAILNLADGSTKPIPHGYYGNKCAKKLEASKEADLLKVFGKFKNDITKVSEDIAKLFQNLVIL